MTIWPTAFVEKINQPKKYIKKISLKEISNWWEWQDSNFFWLRKACAYWRAPTPLRSLVF